MTKDDAIKAIEAYNPAERWTNELNIAIGETVRNEIADIVRALPDAGWSVEKPCENCGHVAKATG